MTSYSTRRRTAVVLTGTGTAGAYHAGVLRALHEAGVRIDLVAGRGVGVVGAVFAAVDGAPRLWDRDGLWMSAGVVRAYGWRASLRIAAWALAAALVLLVSPLALFAVGVLAALVGVLLSLVSLTTMSARLTASYASALDALFAPAALPTIIPRLIVLCLLVGVAAVACAAAVNAWRAPRRRRARLAVWGRLVGAPCSASALRDRVSAELWNLIRGAAAAAAPARSDLGRRYVELLAENLGQPGFRELLLVVHDLDARRDLVCGLLEESHRGAFFSRAAGDNVRAAETIDLAGVGRDVILDALAAALAVPVATEPHLLRFAADGPWRGETHRLCDRPGSLDRLLDEVAGAGIEQVILVSASPLPARPHELVPGRGDVRGRAAEQLAAFEAANLRDAAQAAAPVFSGVHVIRPEHNPIGPLDFAGVYDDRSDRRYAVAELVDRGYEDAFRQFVEPVVAASGDRMETVQS